MEDMIVKVISYIITSLFVVEVIPIKISPLKWMGKRLNGETIQRIDDLERQFIDGKCDAWRTEILDFANSCRNGRRHTAEEWDHIIESLGKYERFCEEYKIDNDRMPVNAKYLRELYTKLSLDGKYEQKKKSGELLECE